MTQQSAETFDLVIKGGRVVNPATDFEGSAEIAISGGRVVRIAPSIDASKARRTIQLDGHLVTPGLIDIHTHVAGGLRKVAHDETFVSPDLIGVHAGVTTVVDAGSTGAYNVGGLTRFVIPQAKTRVIAFINTGILGIFRIPEVREEADIDIDAAVAAIHASPHIRGVKVRMVSPSVKEMGIELPRKAKMIASAGAVPLMVHIGDVSEDHPRAAEAAPQLLTNVLTTGDIVTHTMSPHVGALLDNGRLRPEAVEARDRGVWFDVGVGRANFSFETARAVLHAGFMPDTISSDLTAAGRAQFVHGLTECMNKFLALGLTIREVIEMTTVNPARILGMDDCIGSLEEDREADLTVLDPMEGEWLYRDAMGGELKGSLALNPVLTVRGGEVFPADYGPRPWGWLPERAP